MSTSAPYHSRSTPSAPPDRSRACWRSAAAWPRALASTPATALFTKLSSRRPSTDAHLTLSGALSGERQPVAERQQHLRHSLVAMDEGVERAEGFRLGLGRGGIGHGAAPQRVVDRDHAAGPYKGQRLLVISRVKLLVGIDQGEI